MGVWYIHHKLFETLQALKKNCNPKTREKKRGKDENFYCRKFRIHLQIIHMSDRGEKHVKNSDVILQEKN